MFSERVVSWLLCTSRAGRSNLQPRAARARDIQPLQRFLCSLSHKVLEHTHTHRGHIISKYWGKTYLPSLVYMRPQTPTEWRGTECIPLPPRQHGQFCALGFLPRSIIESSSVRIPAMPRSVERANLARLSLGWALLFIPPGSPLLQKILKRNKNELNEINNIYRASFSYVR